MELYKMYPPQKDSPTTFLLGAITNTDTFAIVGNASLLPQVLPFPLTLGPDKPITETVMVTEIDLESNRIVFTRGSGAMPWAGGTTVGRVFTASDLKVVQDNIIGINTEVVDTSGKISGIEESVTNLEEVVGDTDSGLVKDIADEVTRAKAAEAAEVSRATTAEGVLETKKINKTELPQIITDAAYSADATKLNTTLTRYNASNQQTTSYERTIPLITDSTVGLMTPEAYNEITALRNDVMSLQQQGGKFIGVSFPTVGALDSYDIPDSVNLGDFTYVLDDENYQDSTTRYVFNGAKFEFAFVVNYDPVGIADSEVAGLVKSITGSIDGKIFVESDGTMSVSGWDGINTALAGKVNNNQVLTNVPAGAKFTDTTYTEITTAEIDAGTASTLKTITARRMKYLFDKIVALFPTKVSELTNDSGFLTSVTKSDVGLSKVTNDKQMPISNGVLENYREQLTTLSGTSTVINLSLGNVFTHSLTGNTTYSITNAVNGQAHSFTLIITQTSTVRTLTFPASVKWQGGEIPDLSTASKTYILTFISVDGGMNWLGMFGGEF